MASKDKRVGNVSLIEQIGPTTRKELDQLGKWRCRVPLGRDDHGVPQNAEKWVTGTMREAWAVIDTMRASPKVQQSRLPSVTMNAVTDRYIERLEYLGISLNTRLVYRRRLRVIAALLHDRDIGTITTADVNWVYRELSKRKTRHGVPLSPNTVRHYHRELGGLLKWAQREGLIPPETVLPMVHAEVPKGRKYRAKVLDIRRVHTVIAAAQETDPLLGLALKIALNTGCRAGEVCGLQWQDLQADGPKGPWRLRVRRTILCRAPELGGPIVQESTKSRRDRAIALDARTATLITAERKRREKLLRQPVEPDGFIIANLSVDATGDTPWTPYWLSHGWRVNADAKNVKGRLHDLRHLHATVLLLNGAPLPSVSERLGHANSNITLSAYAHVTEGFDQHNADLVAKLMMPPDDEAEAV